MGVDLLSERGDKESMEMEIEMTRSPKFEVKELVLSLMDQGLANKDVIAYLVNIEGKKQVTAQMHTYKYRKVWNGQTKVVKNMMTKLDVVLRNDTPYCCDPSTETYWSM